MKRHLGLCAVTVAFLLLCCACIPIDYSSAPTPVPTIFDNEGSICFFPSGKSALRINAAAEIRDMCWSSSCTLIIEESHAFTVDQESRVIQLTWYMVAREDKIGEDGYPKGCTADCGGPENWEFVTEELREGEYTVRIGDEIVGSIAVPLDSLNSPECFYSYKDVQASPLQTPAP